MRVTPCARTSAPVIVASATPALPDRSDALELRVVGLA
jgi:hypothetical protein